MERDIIEITDLRARTIIGVDDWERSEKQDVLIHLQLYTDTRRAAESDDLKHSINYRDVCERVLELTETGNFLLVERLAEEIAKLCIKEFQTPKVIVQVQKPSALRFARSVGVTIERESSDYTS